MGGGVVAVRAVTAVMALCFAPSHSVADSQESAITQPSVHEELRKQTDRDLAVLRELNDRVRRGELSETERAWLWQASLASLAREPRTSRPEGAFRGSRFPIFTGPGL